MRTRRSLRGVFLLAWGILSATGGAALAAGQPTPEQAALDKLLYDALKDMHNKAADVYNAGDMNGGYRMFQGGLTMARSLLGHRPEVQQLIDQEMQAADREPSLGKRATMLHTTVELVRSKLKPPAPSPAPNPASAGTATLPPAPTIIPSFSPTPPPVGGGGVPPPLPTPVNPAGDRPGGSAVERTLWQRLGGEAKVAKIVDDWITWSLVDKDINFTRDGKFTLTREKETEMKSKFVGFISDLSKGTVPYTGKSMAAIHDGMAIQPAQFDAFVRTLNLALRQNSVADQDIKELIEKIEATRKYIVK